MPRPEASSEVVRSRMQRQRRRDTKPEVELRRILHSRGLRYRVDHKPMEGMRRRADLVFTRARVAVFVDGCFWHSCPLHATRPASNAEWWEQKLLAKVQRDRDTDRRLEEAGWTVLRAWEHEPPSEVADRVTVAVRGLLNPDLA